MTAAVDLDRRREVAPRHLLDLAGDDCHEPPPPWLSAAVVSACARLDAAPDPGTATAAVAARHGRQPTEVLLTAGAAEAFTVVAHSLPRGCAAVVHPRTDESELALRTAGWEVQRIVVRPGAALRADDIPDHCTLVVVGNPGGPTGRLHRQEELAALRRPGRLLLVDETLLDAVPGEPESLIDAADVGGLLAVRSPTTIWGLAGLPIAYLIGDPAAIARCAHVQPGRSVSSPAIAAATACSTPRAQQEAAVRAEQLAASRSRLLAGLLNRGFVALDGVAPFVLARHPDRPHLQNELLRHGIAVAPAGTFAELPEAGWVRVVVRDETASDRLFAVLDGMASGVQSSLERVGRVILVGGGPGATGSITLDGLLALQRADVIVADRLAPLELIEHVGRRVEVIDAAKNPRGRAMPQEVINEHLIGHARAGRTVVRLKGGDPFVFGRGGEEIEACAAAGVPVQVLPGVSSAIAGPAAMRIPVTHRGMTHGFTVVSGHLPPGHPQSLVDWTALACSGMTLVILMGVATLPAIASELLAAGLPATTPAAVVSDAGTSAQRELRSSLGRVADDAAAAATAPPAIAVIGAVAGLDLDHP